MKKWMHALSVSLIALMVACNSVRAGINDGLVAYYPFNGSFSNQVAGGQSALPEYDVAFSNDTSAGRQVCWIYGRGYTLPPAAWETEVGPGGYLTIPRPVSDIGDATVSFCIKEEGYSEWGGQGFMRLGTPQNGVDLVAHAWMDQPGGQLLGYEGIYLGGKLLYHTDRNYSWAGTVTMNNPGWIHYAVTVAGTNMSLYTNGVFAGATGMSSALPAAGDFQVGRGWWDGGNTSSTRLRARVCNIRIYNRSLTAPEITQLSAEDGVGKPQNTGSFLIGTATGQDGLTPLANIYVHTCRRIGSSWDWNASGYTDSNGQYSLGGLAAGTYRIRFSDGSGAYVPKVYDNIPGDDCWNTETKVVVPGSATVSNIDASLAVWASITGVVTGPDGVTPLANIRVDSRGPGWNWGPSTYTDTEGRYTLDVDAGAYRLSFRDDSGVYAPEVYDNIPGDDYWNTGTDVTVPLYTTVSNINASLALAAHITGTVTGPDGVTPLANILVESRGPGRDWGPSTYTDTEGRYTLDGLAAGAYRLRFSDGDGTYVPEVYNNVPGYDLWNTGNDIWVSESATASNINASLVLPAHITGAVTGPDGVTPLANIFVQTFRRTGSGWDESASGYTDSNGQYSLGELVAGTYRIKFSDGSRTYVSEVYDNIPGDDYWNTGTGITVPEATTVSNINASLALAAHITGTVTGPDGVTPLANIRVDSRGPGRNWGPSTYTDAEGRYTLDGLVAGAYRLSFSDDSGTYAPEVYNNVPGSDLWDTGNDIWVSESATVSNINASLALAAHITGTVTGPDGVAPLANIYVQTLRWTGSGWDGSASGYTDSNGQYSVGGLAAGTYRITFEAGSGTYVPEVYDNIPGDDCWNTGTGITVPESATVPNINASLALAAHITGTVTGSDGVTPLADIEVHAARWTGSDWDWEGYGFADDNGQYSIGGLMAGIYRLTFRDYYGTYASEVYDNIPGDDYRNTGTGITVPESGTVSNINAALALAASISGQVTGDDGVTPLGDISVSCYVLKLGYWWSVGGVTTDSDGRYTIRGLIAGTYKIAFWDYGGTHVPEVYDNNFGHLIYRTGTPISVPESASVTGINASLSRYAIASGRVTAADGGVPLAGIAVALSEISSGNRYWAQTDATGAYAVDHLYPGSYSMRSAPTANYLGQWYEGHLYIPGQDEMPDGATAIMLGSGQNRTGIDFRLDPAAVITGQITGHGIAITNAHVKVKNATYGLVDQAHADLSGTFTLSGLLPGDYTLKAGAPRFADKWWSNAVHESVADTFPVALGSRVVKNFELSPGQNPALVEVTSDPAGATVYLDYQATTNVTPVTLDIGEVAEDVHIASHVVAVKKTGRPWPGPKAVDAREAETVSVHFDLTSNTAGSLNVSTVPAGAQVYVDYADSSVGLSPVQLGFLAPGSHVVLLRKEGCLQPAPVQCAIAANDTNLVVVPLTSVASTNRIVADVHSVPPGASVYVDYLPCTNVTDLVVDWMDPASPFGASWNSASHVIMLRRPGYKLSAGRYATTQTNQVAMTMIHLLPDAAGLQDDNGDGLPDQWQACYDLVNRAPAKHGANDDADGDGMSNEQEMLAGTDPLNAGSRLAVVEVPKVDRQGGVVTLVFDTIPGRTYIIQGTENLMEQWSTLSGLIIASGYQTTLMVPTESGTMAFYRLVVLSP